MIDLTNKWREEQGLEKRISRLNSGCVLVVALWTCFLLSVGASYAQRIAESIGTAPPEQKQFSPNLTGTVAELGDVFTTGSLQQAQSFAKKHGISVKSGRVVLAAEFSELGDAELDALRRFGVDILATYDNMVRIATPLDAIARITEGLPTLRSLRRPLSPIELVTSEGVALTNADSYHMHGWDGTGVKIAVIDGGFGSLADAISAGELPSGVHTYDFTGSGIGGTTHGTAVAEIVYDMSPGSELYLMKVSDNIDLGNAVDTCIAKGIDVINHSMGWLNAGPLDGTGPICNIVDSAYNNGIVWVNAAGNHANRHYRAEFTDSGGSGWHDFDGPATDELNELGYVSSGAQVGVYLSWNDWWASDQDYDLYLFYYDTGLGEWVPYDSSKNIQSGSQWPVEDILVQMDRDADIAAGIRNTNATGNHEMTLFTSYYDLEYYHESSSLLIPGDAASAFTAGGIAASQWDTGPQASYSSQGPTYDSRTKPDIMGPTSVSVYTGGSFSGTSAAAPHVAGSAALTLSRFPTWTPDEVMDGLEGSVSHDFGSPDKDDIYGSGTVYNDELLPVELTLFTAMQTGAAVKLLWETQTETENLWFDVYRSDIEGGSYFKINNSSIPGAGTSSEPLSYSFEDRDIEGGKTYYYRLADVDFRGHVSFHGPISVEVIEIPDRYALWQNHPNPFNPSTKVSFDLTADGFVSLRVYNVAGQLVRTLAERHLEAGTHEVEWNGTDDAGNMLPSGIYVCRIEVNRFTATRKMSLMK